MVGSRALVLALVLAPLSGCLTGLVSPECASLTVEAAPAAAPPAVTVVATVENTCLVPFWMPAGEGACAVDGVDVDVLAEGERWRLAAEGPALADTTCSAGLPRPTVLAPGENLTTTRGWDTTLAADDGTTRPAAAGTYAVHAWVSHAPAAQNLTHVAVDRTATATPPVP